MHPSRDALPGKHPQKRSALPCLAATAFVAALLTLSGCEKEKAASVTAGPEEVFVTEAKREQVPIVRQWVSTLDGSANVQVQARVQGYIRNQAYANGSQVKQGDLLFEIDPRPFEASLAQAQAKLATEIAKQTQAQLDEQRQVQLFSQNAISAAERDLAVQTNAAAKANVEAARAAVAEADLNLTYTLISSPIGGIAGIAVPGTGDLVGPNTGPLTSVSTVDPIKAAFMISEAEYLKSAEAVNALSGEKQSEDQTVELELVLADGRVHPHKGRISAVNREFDVRTGTIQVEALFPNPGNVLRPGFFSRVRLTASAKVGSIVVPQRSVLEVQGTYQVAVVSPDNKVAIRRVKMGERFAQDWVVLEGLNEGERVVVEGLEKAKDGATVVPKPFVPDAKPVADDSGTTDTTRGTPKNDSGTTQEADKVTTNG